MTLEESKDKNNCLCDGKGLVVLRTPGNHWKIYKMQNKKFKSLELEGLLREATDSGRVDAICLCLKIV